MRLLGVTLAILGALVAGATPAGAWTWPADGAVLQPFVLGDDPYAGGQHRGVDIGVADGAGVIAPAGGVVSFVGIVPTNGRTVTILTDDGYAVTLVHLGLPAVAEGLRVGEGDVVAAAGRSGAPEHD
jgi:murein DD-endopeptidase MepM/ murein hydrolase activator NlpD